MSDRGSVDQIHSIDYHRNGVGGESFYCVSFTDRAIGRMVAVVFPRYDKDGNVKQIPHKGKYLNPRVAVFKEDLLPSMKFGENSWRGDHYAAQLFKAIQAHGDVDLIDRGDGETHSAYWDRYHAVQLLAANRAIR